ncbi:MAG: gamma-glutamyltransferase [Actinobacteria bacterium]|nr:gamma-glutamyltransferase [Actinomycetota bacterium]
MSAAAEHLAVALAAPHGHAVDAAAEAVAEGGNALDAALAAAAMLVVTYPHQCALGGDLTALVRDSDGEVTAVLSLGAAPAGVDADALRAMGKRMPRQGPFTVTVPGIVAGWVELAGLGATLGLRRPLLRAAAAAADGVPVAVGLSRAIELEAEAVAADPGLRATFTRDGVPLAPGAVLAQPELAQTLETLAADPGQFYRGEIAAALVDFLRAGGSAMSAEDFAVHTAERPRPLTRTEGDLRWWAAPPPAQGATVLGLLGETPAPLARALAAHGARDTFLGDPRGGAIDVTAMIELNPESRTAPGAYGNGDTVAISAVDDSGRSVVLIQSLFRTFGSGMLEPRTGIVLQNRGSAFSLEPGHPAEIGPGRRPPHSLCPLLGERDGVRAAIGCQGGPAQPLILSQVAAAAVDREASLAAALDRPRWVVGARPLGFEVDTVLAEPGAEGEVAVELGVPGAPSLVLGERYEDRCGHVQIARVLDGERLEAASDPRADGSHFRSEPPTNARHEGGGEEL